MMRIMNFLEENLHFFNAFRNKMSTVGALLPTSKYAALAMASECARHPGPKRVLEVGAGTGAITRQIVKHIGPNDALVCVELEPELAEYLQRRFETEPEFERVRGRTHIKQMSVLDLPIDESGEKFDYIISALPFNSLPPEFVRAVFAHYQTLLKPEGVLSYIEYIGGRYAKLTLAHSEQIQGVHDVVVHEMGRYKFRQDVVWRNAPPAWVHHLRFGKADAAYVENLQPLTTTDRAALPNSEMGIDTAAVPFVAGLGGLALLLKKAAPKTGLWVLPALAAPAIALFFRDPARHTPKDTGLVYASADGEVLSVERLRDERFGKEEWLRIAVFLSVFDVHVNRAPIAGEVVAVLHDEGEFAGGYAAANTADAEHNTAQYTVIDGSRCKCVVAQRVGFLARRIVNRACVGNVLAQGEKFGLIRFGSRTDVYVPADGFAPTVKVGERVVGGETVVAASTDGKRING
jgi:phosphatidylserine decarboxylase